MIYIFLTLISLVEKQLVEEVCRNDTLIIVGETGSGKTTRKLLYTYVFVMEISFFQPTVHL